MIIINNKFENMSWNSFISKQNQSSKYIKKIDFTYRKNGGCLRPWIGGSIIKSIYV